MSDPEYGAPQSPNPGGGTHGAPAQPGVDPQLRARAISSLRRKQGFKTHLAAYVLVNLMLIAIWLTTGISSGVWFPWWVFPLLGWGIGLFFHGWAVYGRAGMSEDRIRREMDRLAGQ